jgi:hypothetical protein
LGLLPGRTAIFEQMPNFPEFVQDLVRLLAGDTRLLWNLPGNTRD